MNEPVSAARQIIGTQDLQGKLMKQHQVLADGLAKLRLYLDRWQLTEGGPPFHTKSSWFQPVQYRGESAMLKIAMTIEECRGARLMVWWDGNGAARVLVHEARKSFGHAQ